MIRHDEATYIHVDFHSVSTCSFVVLSAGKDAGFISMLSMLWLLLPLPQGVNEDLLCE